MNQVAKFDAGIKQSIESTEKYYREQIFSSGCSSIVPIFRINSYGCSAELLTRKLQGSPYIQKNVVFSGKVIEALLDVEIYKYQDYHFFFCGDIPPEMTSFLEMECTNLNSIAEIVQSETWAAQPEWINFEKNIPKLLKEYPILGILDLNALSSQIFSLLSNVEIPQTIRANLDIYTQSQEWKSKYTQNQCSLYFMMEMANQLGLDDTTKKDLAILGITKDVGYIRLTEQIANFEVMHPLVTRHLFSELVESKDPLFNGGLLSSIAVHHEFTDATGPLARMRHPLVMKQIEEGIPIASQISGISDLYFGFLADYSPTLAFSITCGFVLGQGNVKPRYSNDVIHIFSSIFGDGDFRNIDIPPVEASLLLSDILSLLKDSKIRTKAEDMIKIKSETWHERITLALNVVRNIAFHQPTQLAEKSLVSILKLPLEFGLNY